MNIQLRLLLDKVVPTDRSVSLLPQISGLTDSLSKMLSTEILLNPTCGFRLGKQALANVI